MACPACAAVLFAADGPNFAQILTAAKRSGSRKVKLCRSCKTYGADGLHPPEGRVAFGDDAATDAGGGAGAMLPAGVPPPESGSIQFTGPGSTGVGNQGAGASGAQAGGIDITQIASMASQYGPGILTALGLGKQVGGSAGAAIPVAPPPPPEPKEDKSQKAWEVALVVLALAVLYVLSTRNTAPGAI